jgi:monoamine oxidase
VDALLGKMNDDGPDESFVQFLGRHPETPAPVKEHALRYIAGFDAADPARVSVHWLVASRRAEEKIHGDRAFRLKSGYASLVDMLGHDAKRLGAKIELNAPVSAVRWGVGKVEVVAGGKSHEARRALITLPLGVLKSGEGQPGHVRFAPDLPAEKRAARELIGMGMVIRATLLFREKFWAHLGSAGQLSFLFSNDQMFPTWWTRLPEDSAVLTGWAPLHHAEELAGKPPQEIVARAIQSLASIFGKSREDIEALLLAGYSHDWQTDPYSRGAYSYVCVGGMQAPAQLAAPVENTLYFAGEATDTSWNTGTVHGAIGTGRRAAKQMLESR